MSVFLEALNGERRLIEVADKLASLQDYRYSVERYVAGLSQLTLVARPMSDSQQSTWFITFQTTEYMQMPTYWEQAPFILKTTDESRAFLAQVGIEIVRRPPLLFCAELPHSRVYIVCWSVSLSDAMSP